MSAPIESDEPSVGVSLDEVRAEMDPLGAAKFEAAYQGALVKKLATQLQAAMARIADLESQRPTAAMAGDDDA